MKLGIRIQPRINKDDTPIPCSNDWAANLSAQLSERWQFLEVDLPPVPNDAVDVWFSVPNHDILAFEREAVPPKGWSKVIREP